MDKDIANKFKSFMKGKSTSDEEEKEADMGEDDSSPMYDMACRLCDALGVDEDKADKVAEVLMDLQMGPVEMPAEE